MELRLGHTDVTHPLLTSVYCPFNLLRSFKEGWVNLYQKFEIETYTVCGKLILPKNGKAFFKFFLAQLACEFAWICEYLQASCIQHF